MTRAFVVATALPENPSRYFFGWHGYVHGHGRAWVDADDLQQRLFVLRAVVVNLVRGGVRSRGHRVRVNILSWVPFPGSYAISITGFSLISGLPQAKKASFSSTGRPVLTTGSVGARAGPEVLRSAGARDKSAIDYLIVLSRGAGLRHGFYKFPPGTTR